MSRINRLHWSETYLTYEPLGSSLAATKVMHWIVVVTAYKGAVEQVPSTDFFDFSQAVCDTKAKSLTVLVIPEGMEQQNQDDFHYDEETDGYHDLRDILTGLKLFRGVGNFSLRECAQAELPPPHETCRLTPSTGRGLRKGVNDQNDQKLVPFSLGRELKICVESNSPIDYAFKMQKSLVIYTQAFERHDCFKHGTWFYIQPLSLYCCL